MGLDNFTSDQDEQSSEPGPTGGDSEPYSPWVSSNENMTMLDFPPQYIKENVSMEVIQAAKKRGVLYYDSDEEVIVFTGNADKYKSLIDSMGLEYAIEEEMGRLEQMFDMGDSSEQTGLDSFQ